MKISFLHLIFDLLVLVVGLALEEMLPKVGGIGFPVLLSATVYLARCRPMVTAVFFALAAGGAEDAASVLPAMLSASYFLGVALLARWSALPTFLAILVYPGYQLWLEIWTTGLGGAIFSRLPTALLLGAFTLIVSSSILNFWERKAALDEAG